MNFIQIFSVYILNKVRLLRIFAVKLDSMKQDNVEGRPPEARGIGREDQPHAVAAQTQEGLEELSHVEGQEGRR